MKQLNLYSWQGISLKGESCSGYQVCTTKGEAEGQLMAEGIIPYILKLKYSRLMKTWQLKTLIVFFQQLESMLNAGLTLTISLELLMSNHSSISWRVVIELLIKKLRQVKSFQRLSVNGLKFFRLRYQR